MPGYPSSRVIAPTWAALAASDHGAWDLAYWPKFDAVCCKESLNAHGDRAIDYSYLGNYSASFEFWMLAAERRRRYNVMADRTVYGDTVHGVYHGHTLHEKVWGWGPDPMMRWGQEHAWGSCFAELQVGVAPTQFHTFDLAAHSVHSHVELFKPLLGLAHPAALYADNYTEAVAAVDAWAESPAGIPAAVVDNLTRWMKAVADLPVTADSVLARGTSWAALEAARATHAGTDGSGTARALRWELDRADLDVRPWLELLEAGTFSAATLAAVPTSFQVSAEWRTVLRNSVKAHGGTWLHYLHLATIAAERASSVAELAGPELTELINASLAHRDTAHAWRLRAVLEVDPPKKYALYTRAWTSALAETGRGRERLCRNLANEFAYVLRRCSHGVGADPQVASGPPTRAALTAMAALGATLPADAEHDDEVLLMRVVLALYGAADPDAKTAIALLEGHDYAHHGHSDGALPVAAPMYALASRPEVAALWFAAVEANITRGRYSMGPVEQRHLRRAHPPPAGVGPISAAITPAGWVPPIPGGAA